MARQDRLRIRVTDEEMQRWRTAAESHGLPVSAWMRSLADEAAATGQNGRELATQLIALRTDLARGVGNNLNQLAHGANMHGHVDGEALGDAANAVRDAQRDIERVLRMVKPPKRRRATARMRAAGRGR